MRRASTHLSSEWWLNGHWDDSCKDTAVEGTHKLSGFIGPEHEGHSVSGLDQLTTAQLVEHVVGYLLGTISQLACRAQEE